MHRRLELMIVRMEEEAEVGEAGELTKRAVGAVLVRLLISGYVLGRTMLQMNLLALL